MKDVFIWFFKGIGYFVLAVIGLFLPLLLVAFLFYGLGGAILDKRLYFSTHHILWWILLGLYALVFAVALVFAAVKGIEALSEEIRTLRNRYLCKKRGHDWDDLLHCRRCGEVQPHEHEWDGCRCTLCGEIRSEGHVWNGCKCVRCGTIRDEGHDWIEHTCQNCDGSGFVHPEGTSYSYGDPGYGDPDYQEPCSCHHPTEYACRICGTQK
ncbi:MAG: phage holin family protein [Clostridiaceae bacterium]